MTQKRREELEAFVERILSFKRGLVDDYSPTTLRDDQCLVIKWGDKEACPVQQESKRAAPLECKLINIQGVKIALIVRARNDDLRKKIPNWIVSKNTAIKSIDTLCLYRGNDYSVGVFTCPAVLIRFCRYIPFKAGLFYDKREFRDLYNSLDEVDSWSNMIHWL